MRINPKNSLTLIGVFYNYFLTDNPDLHAVYLSSFLDPITLDVTAWLPQPGIRTTIFSTGLLASSFQLMTSYLATYP
jgi:hypothetical protein